MLTGCDSGGDNGGGPLSGDLSLQVEGPSGTTVSVSEEYFWTQNGNPECLSARTSGGTLPLDQDLGLSSVSNCERDADDFDGVRVSVTPSDIDLTIRILSDGDVVAETSETSTVNGSELYRVSVGETFSISDF